MTVLLELSHLIDKVNTFLHQVLFCNFELGIINTNQTINNRVSMASRVVFSVIRFIGDYFQIPFIAHKSDMILSSSINKWHLMTSWSTDFYSKLPISETESKSAINKMECCWTVLTYWRKKKHHWFLILYSQFGF